MIRTPEQLEQVVPTIAAGEWIALDTEADSLHAYPEKLCLIQVSYPGADILIDPLAQLDLHPLLGRLQSKELILHGADYDLRLLHRSYAFVPHSVFDTMWAARLLGESEFGLRDLARRHLNVELEKGPQKMNWAIRPLPERMATYALNDTRYLHPIAELLRSRLIEKGRLGWHREVCANLILEASRPREVDPESLWRIKGSDRLDRAAMAMLRELWLWREHEARAANKPPYFILSHERLVAVATAAARGRACQLLMPRHFSEKRATRLNRAVEKALGLSPSEYPEPRRHSSCRLSAAQKSYFDQLKQVRDQRAQELEMDPTLIASKADLVQLARDPETNQKSLMEWQRRLLFADASQDGRKAAAPGEALGAGPGLPDR